MNPSAPTPDDLLEVLRVHLGARAAGWWEISENQLALVAFRAAPDMPPEVTLEFVQATNRVALRPSALGIVSAAMAGEATVSRVERPEAGAGSSQWLRRFAASCSIAVPLRNEAGAVVRVVSVALSEIPADTAVVAQAIQADV